MEFIIEGFEDDRVFRVKTRDDGVAIGTKIGDSFYATSLAPEKAKAVAEAITLMANSLPEPDDRE